MKFSKYLAYLALILPLAFFGQNSFKNIGNLKIFEEGQMGFHTNLVNNGNFDENLGLAGFYQEGSLEISGIFSPIFYDLESMVDENLNLSTSIKVSNSLNFLYGDIRTNKDHEDVYLQFINNAFYNGENDTAKGNSYIAVDQAKLFTFPVGTKTAIRPLSIEFVNQFNFVKCAYFSENSENHLIMSRKILNDNAENNSLSNISTDEFWKIETSGAAKVTLHWNVNSNISSFLNEVSQIKVVGWNNATLQWTNLGNVSYSGDLENGYVTSEDFNSQDYSIITFGSGNTSKNIILGNYLLTPDGDGINESLVFDFSQAPSNNSLQIYNRWGKLVYEEENYQNDFSGFANTGTFIKKGKKILPLGVYFYILKMRDLNLDFQGFLYLSRN